MADFLPLSGLRYQPAVAGDLGNVLAPPYDVISEEAQRGLYDRSPYNVVRLEYGIEGPDTDADRYQAAAATLAAWRRAGVLQSDARPVFYLYEQRFRHDGREYRRHSIIGRVRLEPWEAGVVLPHEYTLSGPKQDRLRLLRACRTNVSPVLSLYRPDGGTAMAICERGIPAEPAVDALDSAGQGHRLWLIADESAVAQLTAHFAGRTLYIADGHHRYETALAYRDERRAASDRWTGDEPENFVLMALTPADDSGLLILPIHRLVRPRQQPADLRQALANWFDVRDQPAVPRSSPASAALLNRLADEGTRRPSFALLAAGQDPALVALRDRRAVEAQMPAGHSQAWLQLGVNVLQYGVLDPLLGIDMEAVTSGGYVEFTESVADAMDAVESGRAPLAFLLNATRPEEIFAVADAGDRMPQKSTYFYPKLGTGLVLYHMDAQVASQTPAR